MGRVRLELKNDARKALSHFEAAARADSTAEDAYKLQIQAYLKLDNTGGRSQRLAQKIRNLDPDFAPAYLLTARYYQKSNSSSHATIFYYKEYLKRNRQDQDAAFEFALTLLADEKFRELEEIVSRMTNDITTIENIVTDLPATLLQQSIRLFGGIIIITYMNWKLTCLIMILAPILVLFARTFGRKLKKLSTEIQDKLAVSTTILEENISCIQVVKSFVRSKLENERFGNAIEDSFQSAKKRVIISSFFGPSIGFIAFTTSLILLWYGGREVILGEISPGELIAFILYATIIAGPLGSFARLYARMQEGVGASKRIFEILAMESEVRDLPEAKVLPYIEGKVELDDIHFYYRKDQEVIQGISFTVEPGQTIALVGPSGAGKSTLVQLLHRFYDPIKGEIRIDGTPIKTVQQSSYLQQIGIVPQETILFGGTILKNIEYAKPGVTEEEVIQAAKAANAHTFIMETPEGYETIVGEKGIRLSAGQRQRIAIARAILKNPRILILDEATSALDNESELLIQEALKRLMQGRTSFIIAHRLSTIHNAERIIVLDKGKLIESGNHAQLMEKKGLYHKLYTLKSLQMVEEAGEKTD